MDLSFGPKYEAFREEVRAFLADDWPAGSGDQDSQPAAQKRFIAAAAERGYLYRSIPKRYGGSEQPFDPLRETILTEEFERSGAPWQLGYQGVGMVVPTLLEVGADWQREKFIAPTLRGDFVWCQGYSEPGAGSDLASLTTRAERVDGGWALRGTKVFISHAAHAGLFFVVASVDREKKHKGVTAFLVEPASDGIGIGEFPMRTLKRDNLAEVNFDRVFVPDENVLGEPGGGFPVLGAALDMGRYSVAARCVGQAQRCLELGTAYASEREAFGQKIGAFQMIQQKVADMVARTESARALVYRLGRMKDAGVERASLEASLAKLVASEAATQNALDSIQVHGGYGVSGEYEVGRLLLEAKALEFGEGTSELHRKLIAEHALGMRDQ